jgi:hypothetical protein
MYVKVEEWGSRAGNEAWRNRQGGYNHGDFRKGG